MEEAKPKLLTHFSPNVPYLYPQKPLVPDLRKPSKGLKFASYFIFLV